MCMKKCSFCKLMFFFVIIFEFFVYRLVTSLNKLQIEPLLAGAGGGTKKKKLLG